MRRTCEARVVIGASPQSIWDVVSDVTRVGEWSGECRGCTWVGGARTATPGARFRGHNRRGGLRWTRLNEVVRAEPPQSLVWRTVARPPYPDVVEWEVRLTPHEEGTLVSETFRVLEMPKIMERLVEVFVPAHRDRSSDLTEDLDRLRALVESGNRADE